MVRRGRREEPCKGGGGSSSLAATEQAGRVWGRRVVVVAGCEVRFKPLEAPMRPTMHACTRTALAYARHAPPCLHMPTQLRVSLPSPPSHPPTPLLSSQAPMLLELGVHPATAAASSQAAMLISACTSSVVYLVNHAVPQVSH